MYLLTLGAGETAYPSGDELGFTDVLIYAFEENFNFANLAVEMDVKELKKGK